MTPLVFHRCTVVSTSAAFASLQSAGVSEAGSVTLAGRPQCAPAGSVLDLMATPSVPPPQVSPSCLEDFYTSNKLFSLNFSVAYSFLHVFCHGSFFFFFPRCLCTIRRVPRCPPSPIAVLTLIFFKVPPFSVYGMDVTNSFPTVSRSR